LCGIIKYSFIHIVTVTAVLTVFCIKEYDDDDDDDDDDELVLQISVFCK